jgi:hypothetical protein
MAYAPYCTFFGWTRRDNAGAHDWFQTKTDRLIDPTLAAEPDMVR